MSYLIAHPMKTVFLMMWLISYLWWVVCVGGPSGGLISRLVNINIPEKYSSNLHKGTDKEDIW